MVHRVDDGWPLQQHFSHGFFFSPCGIILMLTMQKIMFTISSLVLLEMVQEVLMTLEQTDLFPLHTCQTRTQINTQFNKFILNSSFSSIVTTLNRLQAWLVMGLELAFLGEMSSRTYFSIVYVNIHIIPDLPKNKLNTSVQYNYIRNLWYILWRNGKV